MNDLANHLTLADILAIYRQTKASIDEHCSALRDALKNAQRAGLGDYGYYAERFADERLRSLKIATWRAIVNVSGVSKMLSVQRQEAFDRAIERMDIPEPSEEAIIDLLAGGNAKELFSEMVREAFDWLRPGRSWNNHYKTNRRNARLFVGKKVILERAYSTFLHETTRRHLVCVDKIFHLLDGKPFSHDGYSSPLVDGMVKNKMEGETEYFKWERYTNGNIHLTFKRDDLLKKFNAIAGQLVEPALGDEIMGRVS